MLIWEDDYSSLPLAPDRETRIMFLIAAIFGAALILAALIAPWIFPEAA